MILVPGLQEIEQRTKSDAERRIAHVLSRVDLGSDAVAFHSVSLRSHKYKQQAEADFVILVGEVLVVVEVKGGGVRRHDGTWYSIDRYGNWHELTTSPMEQARSAAYALRGILSEDGVGWYAHEAVVITPDIDRPPNSTEWEATHWLAKDDTSVDALSAALRQVLEGRRTPPRNQPLARHGTLRDRLFNEFTRMPAIDAQRGAIIDEQNRATDDQARVLSRLARNDRMLVTGGAGTGKSLVLIESAKQEADQTQSVLVTYRSTSLTQLFDTHLAGRTIDVRPFGAIDRTKTYDVLFVDEAQDLMTAEDMDVIDEIVAGGRSRGRWRMFLDPNNQAHVEGDFDRDVMALVSDEATIFELDLNVRNTRAIVHVVQEYLAADVGKPGIVHGEKIRWVRAEKPADEAAALAQARELASEGIPKGNIWVIDSSSAASPRQDSKGYVVTSPRYVKGLENEHVIVFGVPDPDDDSAVANFYVAVTRARVSLTIVVGPEDERRMRRLARGRASR